MFGHTSCRLKARKGGDAMSIVSWQLNLDDARKKALDQNKFVLLDFFSPT